MEHAARSPNGPGPSGADELEAGAQAPRRQGQGRNGRAFQGDGGRKPRLPPAARLPADRGDAGVSASPFLTAATLAAAGSGHALLHPPRRRIRRRLRLAERRRRFARRAARRWRRTAPAWPRRSGVAPRTVWSFPTRSIPPDVATISEPLGAGCAAALRRARHGDARSGARRHRRRLRHDPVRRRRARASSAPRTPAGRAR